MPHPIFPLGQQVWHMPHQPAPTVRDVAYATSHRPAPFNKGGICTSPTVGAGDVAHATLATYGGHMGYGICHTTHAPTVGDVAYATSHMPPCSAGVAYATPTCPPRSVMWHMPRRIWPAPVQQVWHMPHHRPWGNVWCGICHIPYDPHIWRL